MSGVQPQPDLELRVEDADRLVASWLGPGARCTGMRRLTGGMINSVVRLELDRPPHAVVVKLHEPGGDDLAAEARSLAHLRSVAALPAPDVLHLDDTGRHLPYAVLVLEELPGVCLDGLELAEAERSAIDGQLGTLLAGLHEHTAVSWGGLDAPATEASWPERMAARLEAVRARPMLETRLSPAVLAAVDQAIRVAPSVLDRGDPGQPTLVHGDVWDGNVLVEQRAGRWQITGLLDPSAEYADPELELAYLEVFASPRPALRAVYDERHPPRAGSEQRRLVYWLHTALLHVALFELEVFRTFTATYANELCELG